jgi:hypothetical protein
VKLIFFIDTCVSFDSDSIDIMIGYFSIWEDNKQRIQYKEGKCYDKWSTEFYKFTGRLKVYIILITH